MIRLLIAVVLAMPVFGQAPAQEDPARLKADLERAQRTLKDFGNLARYEAENVKLPPPSAGEQRVVFIGDSITDFWGRRGSTFFPGKPYVNRGISGQITPQVLLRFRPDVIALKPRAVVILVGTNDIGGSLGPVPPAVIENNLASMVDLARANGIEPVLASMTPVCDCYSEISAKRHPEQLAQLNEWLKRFTAEKKVVYLDYFSAMADEKGLMRKELTYDGLHPNEAGYAVMAPLAEKAIAKALEK